MIKLPIKNIPGKPVEWEEPEFHPGYFSLKSSGYWRGSVRPITKPDKTTCFLAVFVPFDQLFESAEWPRRIFSNSNDALHFVEALLLTERRLYKESQDV